MRKPSLYACHAVHDSLPKGKAAGSFQFAQDILIVAVANKQFHLSLHELEVEQGGASNRLLFFSHPTCSDWRFYTSERSILNDPYLKQHTHLSGIAASAKRQRVLNWSVLASVILLCVFIPVLALMNLHRASGLVAEQIPPEWEQKLGETSFAQYKLGVELMDESEARALLQPLTSPLIQALDNPRFDYQFYIVNDATLNAFALPGGVVVIHSGLILAADNASELLGVLGHEISHVRNRHGIQNIVSHAGTYLIVSALLGDVSGVLATVADAAPLLISQGYSREFESEADVASHQLLLKARINPAGLASFFEKMLQKEREQLDKVADQETQEWLKRGMDFLSSHPATAERISALQNMPTSASGEYLNLTAPFTRLKESVGKFVLED